MSLAKVSRAMDIAWRQAFSRPGDLYKTATIGGRVIRDSLGCRLP